MNSEKKTNIYLLINNHRSTIGIQQQIDVIERVFDKLPQFELIRSQFLIRNQINLMIEENNLEFSNAMKEMKALYPKTKFLLFVTEYLTKSIFGYQLNCFDLKTKLTHAYIDFFSSLNLINVFSEKCRDKRIQIKFSSEKYISKLKGFSNLLFLPPLRLFNDRDSFNNAVQITRREHFLKKTRFLYDLVFSNHGAVNDTYKNFFKSKVVLLPTFIDKKKVAQARYNMKKKHNKKYANGLFFSGRLTSFRKKVISKLIRLNDGYHGYPFLKYVERIDFLAREESNTVPLFELYIKQEKKWLYSSPMRTLMSIEKGYYPVDMGIFKDNDINNLSIKLFNDYDADDIIKFLTEKTPQEYFNFLDEKILQHNDGQEVILKEIENSLNLILD